MADLTVQSIDPFSNPEACDKVEIDGEECPGICTLSGFTRPTEWDVKKGKGAKGANTTLSQLPPSKGKIKFLLWLQEHSDQWRDSFRSKFKYDPTKKTKNAVDIYHPFLADIDVTSVVTEDIGALEPEGKGLYSITVSLLEYLPSPPKDVSSTPTGSTKDPNKAKGSGTSDDPIADAQQKEIDKLLKEAQA